MKYARKNITDISSIKNKKQQKNKWRKYSIFLSFIKIDIISLYIEIRMKILYLFIFLNEIIKSFCLININIGTTGLLIPYTIGALGYIKKNLNINDYHLTGISGGSFASVIYRLENDLSNHDLIWDKLIGNDKYNIKINRNLEEFQQIIKYNIMNNYKNVDIDNIPISIVVSRINKLKIINEKISKFKSLEELLDYCICSSYIPYISGNTFSKKYKNNNYIDGGIFKNLHHFDCVDKCERTIYIHKNMAERVFNYKDYFYLDKDISKKLFNYGWDDCEKIYNSY